MERKGKGTGKEKGTERKRTGKGKWTGKANEREMKGKIKEKIWKGQGKERNSAEYLEFRVYGL